MTRVRRPITILEAWPSCPKEIHHWTTKHLRCYEDSESGGYQTACVLMTDAGYEMRIDPAFMKRPEDFREAVFLHELSHILRGDLLLQLKNRHSKEFNGHIHNLCADVTINDRALMESFKRHNFGALDWAGINEMFPEPLEPFEMQPASRPMHDAILEWLKEQIRSGKMAPKDAEGDGGCSVGGIVIEMDIDPVEAEIKHLEAAMDAPTKYFGRNLPTIKKRAAIGVAPNRPLPQVARILQRWLRRCRIPGTVKVRRRSWVRENRIIDDAPGRIRQPVSKVCILIDVSGSMSGLYDECWAATEWLKRLGNLDGEVWVWADDAARCRNRANQPSVGGGTQIENLWRRVPKCDAAIVLTDGYFASNCPAPARVGNCLYVLPPGDKNDHEACALRPQDAFVRMV